MLSIQIDSFSYTDKVVLEDISFKVAAGEHVSILGESGSGKSTLLHIIYGLIHLTHGEIYYNDKKLLGPTQTLIPGEPFMKLVAQEFNIMPFSTVAENIGSHLSRLNQEKDENRIDELLEVVDLTSYKDTLVKYLSGGQKQRVALAKALANEPEVLLLDEPFSNIDNFRKSNLRRKIFHYLKSNNISCISATHDSEEALAFSDNILLMKGGRIERFGTPETLYHTAKDAYQSGFFADANLLPENIISDTESTKNVVIYPHQLEVSKNKTKLSVKVMASYFQGSHYLIQSLWKDREVFFNHFESLPKGKDYWLRISSK